MKHMTTKLKLTLLLVLVAVVCFAVYLRHVGNVYANAAGQERAILLSKALVDEYSRKGEIPDEFVRDVSFFFSDERNECFTITVENKSAFHIVYKPKSTWVCRLFSPKHQVLEIWWSKDMGDLKVESSIQRP